MRIHTCRLTANSQVNLVYLVASLNSWGKCLWPDALPDAHQQMSHASIRSFFVHCDSSTGRAPLYVGPLTPVPYVFSMYLKAYSLRTAYYYLWQGGNVFIGVSLFVCLFVNGITQKPLSRFFLYKIRWKGDTERNH